MRAICVRGCPGPVCVAELILCRWMSLFGMRGWVLAVCAAECNLCVWLSRLPPEMADASNYVSRRIPPHSLKQPPRYCYVWSHLSSYGNYWNCLAPDAKTCVLRWKWVTFWVLGVSSGCWKWAETGCWKWGGRGQSHGILAIQESASSGAGLGATTSAKRRRTRRRSTGLEGLMHQG